MCYQYHAGRAISLVDHVPTHAMTMIITVSMWKGLINYNECITIKKEQKQVLLACDSEPIRRDSPKTRWRLQSMY